MSKAFKKEDGHEEQEDVLDGAPRLGALPQGAKNYITPAGAEKLKKELHELLYVDRPEIVKTVAWAASNGDRSENGDYIYGKRRLREIDRRIRFLTKRLDAAEIIDPQTQKSERVLFGATVTFENESGEQKTISIVGIDETNVKDGLVSWISPIARALLNSRVGEIVNFRSPQGEEELEVISICYKPLETGK